MPGVAIVFGFIINAFNVKNTGDDVLEIMREIAIGSIIAAAVGWLWSFIFYSFWQHLAEDISFDLRRRFLKKLLV